MLLAASALFPIYFMLSNALRTEADWAELQARPADDVHLRRVPARLGGRRDPDLLPQLGDRRRRSRWSLSVVLASTAGYSFSKLRWRGRGFGFLFTLAWMAIPPLLLMVPIYIEMVEPRHHRHLLVGHLRSTRR